MVKGTLLRWVSVRLIPYVCVLCITKRINSEFEARSETYVGVGGELWTLLGRNVLLVLLRGSECLTSGSV